MEMVVELKERENVAGKVAVLKVTQDDLCEAELHLSGCWLSGSPIIRIGLARPVNLSRILQN